MQFKPRTVDDIVRNLPVLNVLELPAPLFTPSLDARERVVCGVASMKDHMTDEGWQITHGLFNVGYQHAGHGLEVNSTDLRDIIAMTKPGTLVMQDKREWGFRKGDFRDENDRYTHECSLSEHPEIFKLTILKDAQQDPEWQAEYARDIGCHAWIIYYHPVIVKRLAPYVRPEHLVRTYHTLDPNIVPPFNTERHGTLFSGAISPTYPLRERIRRYKKLPVTTLVHPGYHRKGCNTAEYMSILSRHRVAICTSSKYGYALRKIIEATACGCRVITDLPVDEELPMIDSNLIRVHPDIHMNDLHQIIIEAEETYDTATQAEHAKDAVWFYDYVRQSRLLALNIKIMRDSYR